MRYLLLWVGMSVGMMEMFPARASAAEKLDMDEGVGEPPILAPITTEEALPRVNGLASRLRCPVCQGLSVGDSRSDAALAMKARIAELVEKGYSDAQVVDYFVDRYGEWALLKPSYDHLFVWIAPGIALIIGCGLVARQFRGTKSTTTGDEKSLAVGESPNPKEVSSYRQRILDELESDA